MLQRPSTVFLDLQSKPVHQIFGGSKEVYFEVLLGSIKMEHLIAKSEVLLQTEWFFWYAIWFDLNRAPRFTGLTWEQI